MPYYHISFNANEMTDCSLVTKKDTPYEYFLVTQYKRFVQFGEDAKPEVLLCKAKSLSDAEQMGKDYLTKINKGSI